MKPLSAPRPRQLDISKSFIRKWSGFPMRTPTSVARNSNRYQNRRRDESEATRLLFSGRNGAVISESVYENKGSIKIDYPSQMIR